MTKIAITYNADTHLKPHLNEFERLGEDQVAESARDVFAALSGAHECALFPVGDDVARALLEIRSFAPDLVFNLCEGVVGRTRWEAHFVLALDLLGIPYCGCDGVSIALTQDKGFVKQFLRRIGAPVADGFAAEATCPEGQLRAEIARLLAGAASNRVIVKPVREDGGIGVDTTSVVRTVDAALDRCRVIWDRYHQAALVEVFLDGPEYNLALYAGQRGVVTLPPGQILFAPTLLPEERVVGWRAKWDTGSVEDLSTRSCIVRNMDPALYAEITTVCRHAAAMIGIHGYCRFDLRQGPDGRIHIIDINANPDIGPDSGFRKALAAADIRFEDFLAELIAARRGGRKVPWRSAA